jgi:serine/threonine protein kinase/tetratricopeptide (TPR) repeat protein
MTPERWQEVKELFAQAVAREAEARSAYLAAQCGGDEELRDTVERLLASHADAADFIETSPVRGLASDVASQGRLTGCLRGSYRLGRRVGAGGMGEVYESWDTRTGQRVAIKVLTDDGVDAARRLKREAHHALELAHSNICEVHEVADDETGAFIAMEFLDGRVLSDAVPEGGFSASEAIELAVQLADAIAHAHAHGIIHRDLKCANLMLMSDGRLKVLDFGLARQLPRKVGNAVSAASLSEAGVIAGTLSCLAPEVLKGERADARSDVWAYGIVLHELLTGHQPFEGRTPFELASAVLREPAPLLPSSVPGGLRAIRDNCLAKDPADRYQHGGELLSALRALQSGERVARRTPSRLSKRIVAGVAAALLASTTAISWVLVTRQHATVRPPRGPSIAVLPLRDASSGPEPGYFADGVTDALIDRLGTIEGLRIISRTSTSRYRDPTSFAAIWRDLQADVAVRGSVEHAADRVRLNVELVDTATGRSLWQNTLERRANEVLALENDAVRAIVEHMGVPVTTSQQTRLRVARAVDPVVYEHYLKGRFYWNKRTDGSLEQAITFYQAAIERDPTYAPAHAALADCYNQLGTVMVGTASPADMRPRAKSEAIAAIQADESLAEAHATLAYISHYDWDWATAEREFHRAIELNPNLALAHAWYANYLASRKRLSDALAEVRRAEELDPFSLVVVTNVGWTLAYARRSDDAVAAFRRALALDPSYIQARWRLGSELSVLRRFDEAIAETQKVVELTGRSPSSLAWLAQSYARAGRRSDAIAILNELINLSRTRYVSPVGIYAAYFFLGDADSGFAWVEKALQERSNGVAYIAVDHLFDRVRDDPRYRRIVDRIGLVDVP